MQTKRRRERNGLYTWHGTYHRLRGSLNGKRKQLHSKQCMCNFRCVVEWFVKKWDPWKSHLIELQCLRVQVLVLFHPSTTEIERVDHPASWNRGDGYDFRVESLLESQTEWSLVQLMMISFHVDVCRLPVSWDGFFVCNEWSVSHRVYKCRVLHGFISHQEEREGWVIPVAPWEQYKSTGEDSKDWMPKQKQKGRDNKKKRHRKWKRWEGLSSSLGKIEWERKEGKVSLIQESKAKKLRGKKNTASEPFAGIRTPVRNVMPSSPSHISTPEGRFVLWHSFFSVPKKYIQKREDRYTWSVKRVWRDEKRWIWTSAVLWVKCVWGFAIMQFFQFHALLSSLYSTKWKF